MKQTILFVLLLLVAIPNFSECHNPFNFENQAVEFPCLKAHLQQDAEKPCEEEVLTNFNRTFKQMAKFTAYRGNPTKNLQLTLRDVNNNMRENYAKLIQNVGKNIFPLMIVTDGEPDFVGVGGVFKVYFKDGSMKRIVPVSPTFEIHKSLSHVALGIFSIISPYFKSPKSISWQPALLNFQSILKETQHLLKVNKNILPCSQNKTASLILKRSITFIDKTVASNSVNISEYQKYAHELAPQMEKSMIWAAEAHAKDTIPALLKLKEKMGENEWKKLYVIIPTVWPVSLYNIRLQSLEKVMSFDQIKNQVLIVEGANTEEEAKTTLGRIMVDRVIAQLTWGGLSEENMKDHLFSLSTRRDLLSTPASKELKNVCKKLENEDDRLKCPFTGRSIMGNSYFQKENDYPEGDPNKKATTIGHVTMIRP